MNAMFCHLLKRPREPPKCPDIHFPNQGLQKVRFHSTCEPLHKAEKEDCSFQVSGSRMSLFPSPLTWLQLCIRHRHMHPCDLLSSRVFFGLKFQHILELGIRSEHFLANKRRQCYPIYLDLEYRIWSSFDPLPCRRYGKGERLSPHCSEGICGQEYSSLQSTLNPHVHVRS